MPLIWSAQETSQERAQRTLEIGAGSLWVSWVDTLTVLLQATCRTCPGLFTIWNAQGIAGKLADLLAGLLAGLSYGAPNSVLVHNNRSSNKRDQYFLDTL